MSRDAQKPAPPQKALDAAHEPRSVRAFAFPEQHPTMWLRPFRDDCARKFGRYWNAPAAAIICSLVTGEIPSDPEARFNIFETVAGVTPCCAKVFNVT
jgi:hypothetical protein